MIDANRINIEGFDIYPVEGLFSRGYKFKKYAMLNQRKVEITVFVSDKERKALQAAGKFENYLVTTADKLQYSWENFNYFKFERCEVNLWNGEMRVFKLIQDREDALSIRLYDDLIWNPKGAGKSKSTLTAIKVFFSNLVCRLFGPDRYAEMIEVKQKFERPAKPLPELPKGKMARETAAGLPSFYLLPENEPAAGNEFLMEKLKAIRAAMG